VQKFGFNLRRELFLSIFFACANALPETIDKSKTAEIKYLIFVFIIL